MAGGSLSRGLLDAYVCSANTAIEMKLITDEGDIDDEDLIFYPEFTHQFFGDGESIFGYRDLKISLYYSACRLVTYLGVSYSDKISKERSDGVQPDDIIKIIGEKLQPGFLTNIDLFSNALKKDSTFKPFGEKLHSMALDDEETNSLRSFEIYMCNVSFPGFKDYHERLQNFVLWFIDAASYIDVDDDRWDYFTMYEKFDLNGKACYAIVGYTTVYRYYAYLAKMRPRISQILVLPPFQKRGLGAELLQTIYNWYIKDANTVDITVEDPSDNFTSLRDYVDSKNCMKLPSFHPSKLQKGFSDDMKQEAQSKLKINKKQARRVYEILRLHATDTKNEEAYKGYRLAVKNRLNAPYQRQRADMVKLQISLTADELKATMQCANRDQRIEQLEKQYRDLEEEYRRTLERLAAST